MKRPHVIAMTDRIGRPAEVHRTFVDSTRVADGFLVAGTADWHEHKARSAPSSHGQAAWHAAEAVRLRAELIEHRVEAARLGLYSGVVVRAEK